MLRMRTLTGAVLLGVLVFAGCSDLPTAPEPDAEASYGLLSGLTPLIGGGGGGSDATVLERIVPLAHDETVTRTIGRWGGVIRLPHAGLTVIVPFGAVSSNVDITVTAPAGDLVGYYFGPHGIEFDRPLTLLQDMTKTKGLGLGGLSVEYFDGELAPTVSSLETLILHLTGTLGIFRVEHFCGYVIATN